MVSVKFNALIKWLMIMAFAEINVTLNQVRLSLILQACLFVLTSATLIRFYTINAVLMNALTKQLMIKEYVVLIVLNQMM